MQKYRYHPKEKASVSILITVFNQHRELMSTMAGIAVQVKQYPSYSSDRQCLELLATTSPPVGRV